MWTREDDMTLGYYRPQGTCRIKGAIDENGDVVAVYSHLVTQIIFPDMADSLGGMFPIAIPPKFRQKIAVATAGVMSTSTMMGFFEGGELVASPYDIPNFRADFTDSVITFSFFEEIYLLLIPVAEINFFLFKLFLVIELRVSVLTGK